MLDLETGNLNISDSVVIKHDADCDSVKKLHIGQIQKIRDMKSGWVWIDEKNVEINGNYFVFNFAFFNNKLSEIIFWVKDTPYNLSSIDKNSSYDDVIKAKNFHDKWLNENNIRQGRYEWGSVHSRLVERFGASSYIEVKYND